jgi:hypothetical protein
MESLSLRQSQGSELNKKLLIFFSRAGVTCLLRRLKEHFWLNDKQKQCKLENKNSLLVQNFMSFLMRLVILAMVENWAIVNTVMTVGKRQPKSAETSWATNGRRYQGLYCVSKSTFGIPM